MYKVISLSFKEVVFPNVLKSGQFTSIHKREDTHSCNNYRPILLLSIFSKLFEETLYNRVYSYLSKYRLISPKQYGFRNNHSIKHALISLTEAIKNSFLPVVDLKEAFGTADHQVLLYQLPTIALEVEKTSRFDLS